MNTFKPFSMSLLALAIVLASTPILGHAGLAPTENTVESYQKAAEAGDAKAQNKLGDMYYYGKVIAKDEVKAVEWYTKSAEQGYAKAQSNLGYMYQTGKGATKDIFKAMDWYTKAAEQGNTYAQNALGNMYRDGKVIANNAVYYGKIIARDDVKAVELYTKAAEQGDADAQANLGWMYKNGRGVTQDNMKAFLWYMKAADQGDAFAQYSLGNMYKNGEGTTKDMAKAVVWYKKSAEQGYANAQTNLGVCYEQGNGIGKDETKAVEWYRKAAEQGHEQGQINLGMAYTSGKGIAKDSAIAVEWFRKAAEQGSEDAQYNLGVMYADGLGVARDEAKAVEWYRKAAEQGNANAQNNLGAMYVNGLGVTQDAGKAREWYRKAAEQGHVGAQHNLAKLPSVDYRAGTMNVSVTETYIGIGGSKENVTTLPNNIMSVNTSIDYSKLATQYLKSAKNGEVLAKQKLEYLLQTEKIQDSNVKRDAQAVFALPPKIQWLTNPPTQTNQEVLELTVSLKDVGTGIGDVRLLINDVAIDQKGRGFARTDSTPTEQRTFTLKLPQGTHKITIEAYNAENLGAKVAKLETTITSTYQKPYKPRLHAVVIGIDQYKNSQLKLNYAVSDAKAIYTKLQNQVGSLYDAGVITLLTDKTQTSKSAIEAAITNISKNIQLGDVFVLYVAGHGINYPSSGYYMLSADTLQTSEDRVKDTSIGREQLQSLIAQVPTNKKLILLDTCNSGGALDASQLITTRGRTDDTGVITGLMQRKSGATVLMASES
ncbi:MAG: SEL1-like repeat protein, partial [Pseudomonadales bacterium]|nr:SEL1-like repeat protein [Pseudomonadales bacterium]